MHMHIEYVTQIVLNDISDEELDAFIDCKTCKEDLIITQNHFLNDMHLNRRLDKIIQKKVDIIKRMNRTDFSSNTPVESVFEKLAARLWSCLCLKDVYLPNISVCGHSNTLARLHLNKEQLEFMQLRQKHIILRGPYGSGKSVLVLTKFLEVAQKAGPNNYLYLICCSDDTMYTKLLKSRVINILKNTLREDQIIIMNKEEYSHKYNLSTVCSISTILKDVRVRHEKDGSKFDIVFDEYDASNLTEIEGGRIYQELQESLESYVLIVSQSIEIYREKVTRRGLLRRNSIAYDGYNFDATKMVVKTLNVTMRNSTTINALSRSAIKVMEKVKSEYDERTLIDDILESDGNYDEDQSSDESDKKITIEETKVKQAGRSQDQTKSSNTRAENRKLPQNKMSDQCDQNGEQANVTDKKVEITVDQNVVKDEKKKDLIVGAKFDHILKEVSCLSQNCTGVMIESSFKFPGAWYNGHKIEGNNPHVLYPFDEDVICYTNVNYLMNKYRMYFTLNEIIHIGMHVGNIGIICFDVIDAQLISEILTSMNIPVQLYAPTLFNSHRIDEIPDLTIIMKTHIVVTDHVGAQGLELEKLIVAIDPNERFVHQYLIEAFTRCIETLYFLLIQKDTSMVKEKGRVCQLVFEKWISEGLVDVSRVKVCELHKDIHDTTFCKRTIKKETVYSVHLQNETFNICSTVKNCIEFIPDVQKLSKLSSELTNTKHIDEVTRRSFDEIEMMLGKTDMKTFRNECGNYTTNQIRKSRNMKGESLLDAAVTKWKGDHKNVQLMVHILWLITIDVPYGNKSKRVIDIIVKEQNDIEQTKIFSIETDEALIEVAKEINVELKSQIPIKILLLGPGEVGKSTFVKQISIIYENKIFSKNDRLQYKDLIYTNILQSLLAIIRALEALGIAFENPDRQKDAKQVFSSGYKVLKETPDDIDPQLLTLMKRLWSDAGVQKSFQRSREYQLLQNAGYYLSQLERIGSPGYIPTGQDVLRTREKTTGIAEKHFDHKGVSFKVCDTGGERSERRKWVDCFEEVTAVIYFVDLTGYDRVLAEDEETNRMHESLELFECICSYSWFKDTTMILFLNFNDMFAEKITTSPLTICFPEFTGANTYDEAGSYIKQKFEDKKGEREIYTHFTCAVDTENIRFVFNEVADVIIKNNLKDSELF